MHSLNAYVQSLIQVEKFPVLVHGNFHQKAQFPAGNRAFSDPSGAQTAEFSLFLAHFTGEARSRQTVSTTNLTH